MSKQNTLNWELSQNDDKIALRLTGELSRDTLLPLWQQRSSFLSAQHLNQSTIQWDLAQIQRIDSAGFALLCDLLHASEQSHQQVCLENAPQQLFTLADLFGLENWIAKFTHSNQ